MIHIVSGEALMDLKEIFLLEGTIIPFNEAIIDGKVVGYPFSKEFIIARSQSLHVSEKDYQLITVSKLDDLNFNEEIHIEDIHLYFGYDMFCQMNMLCLCVYLKKQNVNEVTVHIIDEYERNEIEQFSYNLLETSSLYEDVILSHKKAMSDNVYLNKVLPLYFHYLNSTKEEYEKIINDQDYKKLYGLGDIQLQRWKESLSL